MFCINQQRKQNRMTTESTRFSIYLGLAKRINSFLAAATFRNFLSSKPQKCMKPPTNTNIWGTIGKPLVPAALLHSSFFKKFKNLWFCAYFAFSKFRSKWGAQAPLWCRPLLRAYEAPMESSWCVMHCSIFHFFKKLKNDAAAPLAALRAERAARAKNANGPKFHFFQIWVF